MDNQIQKNSGSEAGAVAFTTLYGTKTADGVPYEVQINVTARSETARLALDEIIGVIAYAEEKYRLRPYSKRNMLPVQKTAVQETAVEEPVKEEPVYEPVPAEVQELRATELRILPRPDGRVELQFWAGRQYPELKAVLTPEQASELLRTTGDWQPSDFIMAKSYNVDFVVKWRYSDKVSQNGKPYKNVVAVLHRTAQGG